jgi:hypothetical protein
VAVGTETLAVNPSLSNGIGSLLLGKAHHLGDNGSSGNLDQDDVVQADLVEGVLESQNTLDLVCLDHGLENVADLQDLAVPNVTAGAVGAGDPVGDGENTTEVVRGVAPLSGEPAVVVVEPANHGTDVECAVNRVQLVGSTRHTGTVGDNGSVDNGAQQLGALLELQSLQTAAESIQEDQTSGVVLYPRRMSN